MFLIRVRHASAAALVLIRNAQHRVFLETCSTHLFIRLPEQSIFCSRPLPNFPPSFKSRIILLFGNFSWFYLKDSLLSHSSPFITCFIKCQLYPQLNNGNGYVNVACHTEVVKPISFKLPRCWQNDLLLL